MREYIPKQLYIDREAYKIVLSVIRRYDRMCRAIHENRMDTIYASPIYRGAGGITRPTESKAIHIVKVNGEMERMVKAVDQALVTFDTDERAVILNHIVKNAPLKRLGTRGRDRTMERRKQQFIHKVAQNLHLV